MILNVDGKNCWSWSIFSTKSCQTFWIIKLKDCGYDFMQKLVNHTYQLEHVCLRQPLGISENQSYQPIASSHSIE